MSNIQTTVSNDVTKVETAVKGAVSSVEKTVSTVETDVKADLAKTYSAKIVALWFAIGLIVGPIALAILKAL